MEIFYTGAITLVAHMLIGILEHVLVLIGTDQIDVKFYVWEIVLFNWAAVNMLTA